MLQTQTMTLKLLRHYLCLCASTTSVVQVVHAQRGSHSSSIVRYKTVRLGKETGQCCSLIARPGFDCSVGLCFDTST
jgi:hypothetical protein